MTRADVQELLARRERLLGPGNPLFYDDPVHLVRGEGVWLHGDDGERRAHFVQAGFQPPGVVFQGGNRPPYRPVEAPSEIDVSVHGPASWTTAG